MLVNVWSAAFAAAVRGKDQQSGSMHPMEVGPCERNGFSEKGTQPFQIGLAPVQKRIHDSSMSVLRILAAILLSGSAAFGVPHMTTDSQTSPQSRVTTSSLMSGLSAEYFVVPPVIQRLSEIDFGATPAALGVVDGVDRSLGDAPFWDSGPTDRFAARYTGALVVEIAGRYTFSLTSDDGSALHLDGARVIDNDGLHAAATRQVTLDLDAGTHPLELLYFEQGGVQVLRLSWQGPDTGGLERILNGAALVHEAQPAGSSDSVQTVAPPPAGAGLAADYFILPTDVSRLSEIDFGATPAGTGVVAALDMPTGRAPFWQGGPDERFAARYTGDLNVKTAGSYTLYLTSDDGSALYLDGEKIIDNDGAHATTERAVTLDLAAGAHAIEVRYFERTGDQALRLEWRGPDSAGLRRIIDHTALAHGAGSSGPDEPDLPDFAAGLVAEYFLTAPGTSRLSQIDFAARPAATEVVASLDYANGHLRFWDGGPADNFAARYTGALQVQTAGRYTLYLTSDDGSALFLDGVRVISNGGVHAARLRTVTLDLEAGAHAFELRYFERSGRQALMFEWEGPDSGGVRRVVDGTSLVHDAEAEPETGRIVVAGQAYEVVNHAVATQGSAVHSLSDNGTSITLTDNGWKAIEGTFEVVADTVITFRFAANVIGEVHGIGFANGDSLQSATFFQLAGTQRWGLKDADWTYVPGSGEVAVRIEVGKYFTGTFDRLVLGMDDDRELSADSRFTDIDIGLVEPEAENTAPVATADRFETRHDTALEMSVAKLLANDRDADGDALSLITVESLSGGTVTRAGDLIRFTPDAGFRGTAQFAYTVSDGAAASTATVSVEVSASGYATSLLASVPEGVGLGDPSLAVGLDGFAYWKSPPFLNLMKQAALPGTRNSLGQVVSFQELAAQGYLDENGYPVKMYPGNNLIPTWQQGYDIAVSIHHQNDFVRHETSGQYVVEWAGEGDIQFYGFAVTTRETHYSPDGAVAGGRMTGTWAHEDELKMIKILNTDPEGTGNHIRDISIVRAEYKDMYDVGGVFDPRYTALIKDHHTLRFMDWMQTNGSDVKTLADVASLDSLTWAGSVNSGWLPEVGSEGVLPIAAQIPFETMVQLANEIGADPWFNIPIKADDAYVRALAAYVNAHLDKGLVAKFELSNEVWNWAGGFEQTREAALLGTDGASSTDFRALREYYGYRSAEIKAILDSEMSRVDTQVVLGTQTVYYEVAKWVEAGVSRYFADQGTAGQMSDVFDALAVTGYFSAITENEFALLRQHWYTRSQAEFAAGATAKKHDLFVERAADYLANGIDALAPEELALVAKRPDGSVNPGLVDPLEGDLRSHFAENKRMAEAWGLELIQYEADSHISPASYRGESDSEWYKALNKSDEMGALTARMAEIFREEGGTLVNDFGHLGETEYGLWGTRTHFADENPVSAAYDTYNTTAAGQFGSINVGRDLAAFLNGVVANGTVDGDVLIGTAKRDYLIGGDGNDLLVGGAGADGLHGGSGVDLAVFAGSRDEFTFRSDKGILIMSGPSGEARLLDVEVVAFASDREFVRSSDLSGTTSIASLPDLLALFDPENSVLAEFF